MKKQWTTVADFILHGKVSSKYLIIEAEGINQVGDGGALTLVRTGNVGTPNQSFTDTGNNTCVDDNGDVWEVQKGTILNYNGTDNWFGGSFGSDGVGTYVLNDSSTWEIFPDKQDIAKDILESQQDLLGGKLFKGSNGDTVENGDVVPVGTTHLRIPTGIVAMSPIASGTVSSLTETGATIDGTLVKFHSASNLNLNTLTDALNYPLLHQGLVIEVKERESGEEGGGTWDVVLASSVTPNGHDIVQCINVTSLALVLRPQESRVTLKQLGFVSGVNAASGLNAIATDLYNRGVRELILDIDNLKIDSAVDFANLKLTGQNNQLTGDGLPLNYESLTGCKVQGFRPDILNTQMPEPVQQGVKLVYRVNEDRYQVLSPSPDKDRGGVLIDMKKDVTSNPSNSIGGPAELLRMTWVYKCTGIYSWNANYSSSSGTWSQWTVPESYLRHDGDDVGRPTQALQNGGGSGGVGESLTWTVTGVLGKKQNIAIVGTAAAADCDLLVDGVVIQSLSPSDWTGFVNVVEFDVPTGTHTVEIRQTSASGVIRVLGINFSEIKNTIPGTPVDTFAYYRDPNFTHYSLSNGAHDYAIQDDDCDLWAGSYHGGETAVEQTFIIDGDIQSAPVSSDGGLFSCGELRIRQRTVIDWTGSGGGLINTHSMTSFGASQIKFDCSMESPSGMYANKFYTSMMGANEQFTSLITPINEDLVYDNGRTYLGNTNKVTWYHAATGTELIADSNIIENHKGQSGGAEVNRILGSYAKLYYGPVQRGRQLIEKINFSTQKTFK